MEYFTVKCALWVVIPGVVGLTALEGLLGFSFPCQIPFYPFYLYNKQYHNGIPAHLSLHIYTI